MKKVLLGLIRDGKAGGVDSYILNLYSDMLKQGMQVDLLSSAYTPELANKLEANGSKLIVIPKMSHFKKQYNAVKSIAENGHYDILYLNISTAVGWPVAKGALKGGITRVIVHSHSSGYYHRLLPIQLLFRAVHYLSRPAIRKYATDYLACSDTAARWLFGEKAAKHKTAFILNEIDKKLYTYSEELRKEYRNKYNVSDNFVIGTVGSLLKTKNQIFLLKLMKRLKETVPFAKLLLVGEGEERRTLENYIEKNRLNEFVIFAGFQNTADGIINAFDVFCLPSLCEGFPYVAVEAQTNGLPCVLNDCITKDVKMNNACHYLPLDVNKWICTVKQYEKENRNRLFTPTKTAPENYISQCDLIDKLCNNRRFI